MKCIARPIEAERFDPLDDSTGPFQGSGRRIRMEARAERLFVQARNGLVAAQAVLEDHTQALYELPREVFSVKTLAFSKLNLYRAYGDRAVLRKPFESALQLSLEHTR